MVLSLATAALLLVMSQQRGLPGPPKRDTTKTVQDFVARWVDTAKVGADYDPAWTDLCSLAVAVPDSVRTKIARTRHPGGNEGGKLVLTTDQEGFVIQASYLDRRRTESTSLFADAHDPLIQPIPSLLVQLGPDEFAATGS